MRTQEELTNAIEDAQQELNSLMQTAQRETAKQRRLVEIESASAAVERTDKELENLKGKIVEAAQKLDDAIKARFLAKRPYVAVGVSTAVDNTAQQFILLKDALLRKGEERAKFSARHEELVRIEQSSAPHD